MALGGKRPGSGRKKKQSTLLAEAARDYIAGELEANLKPIVERAITDAKNGDKSARDWLSERGWGKVPQAVLTKDEEGNDMPISGIVINAPDSR